MSHPSYGKWVLNIDERASWGPSSFAIIASCLYLSRVKYIDIHPPTVGTTQDQLLTSWTMLVGDRYVGKQLGHIVVGDHFRNGDGGNGSFDLSTWICHTSVGNAVSIPHSRSQSWGEKTAKRARPSQFDDLMMATVIWLLEFVHANMIYLSHFKPSSFLWIWSPTPGGIFKSVFGRMDWKQWQTATNHICSFSHHSSSSSSSLTKFGQKPEIKIASQNGLDFPPKSQGHKFLMKCAWCLVWWLLLDASKPCSCMCSVGHHSQRDGQIL